MLGNDTRVYSAGIQEITKLVGITDIHINVDEAVKAVATLYVDEFDVEAELEFSEETAELLRKMGWEQTGSKALPREPTQSFGTPYCTECHTTFPDPKDYDEHECPEDH